MRFRLSKNFGHRGKRKPQGVGYGAASDLALMHVEPILQMHIVKQRARKSLVREG